MDNIIKIARAVFSEDTCRSPSQVLETNRLTGGYILNVTSGGTVCQNRIRALVVAFISLELCISPPNSLSEKVCAKYVRSIEHVDYFKLLST